MSAIVCGKRSFFEDLPSSPQSSSSSPPVSKRLRCFSSTSPVRFSPFSNFPSLVDQPELVSDMDDQLIEKALNECDNDLDAAIKSLHELSLGYGVGNTDSAEESNANMEKGTTTTDGDTAPSAQNNLHMDGAEWWNCLNKLKLSSARTQFSNAVAIQHERQKEYDYKNQEVRHLEQLVSQYQEQLRTLEVNNYALTMHLQQAQQNNSLPGRLILISSSEERELKSKVDKTSLIISSNIWVFVKETVFVCFVCCKNEVLGLEGKDA
ncbi:hypothetical protein LOK49_LG04G02528 [Camellia lanceoleosa]|uniref:Uncharacterized protein n=1 Tax=Camellia lanceoleosa TaxID=1840588 RepID=A0ACC0I0J9_9ERIC|nr:hypothetical protein LOK49_LG04G02528 [Camellia lanceoleosa]